MASRASHQLFKPGAVEDKGEYARLQTYVGAIAMGDMVKSTLGPWGMSKILQPAKIEAARYEKSNVTNDGATILKSVWTDNPAAKILADMSLQQDSNCGDGTTGVVVLVSELLRNAESLTDMNIHPQTIIAGYRAASDIARQRLSEMAKASLVNNQTHRDQLLNVARTTLSSKFLSDEKNKFSEIVVTALEKTAGTPNPNELIKIIKKVGGTSGDSFLEDGFILEKKFGAGQPNSIENCKILVANTPMDTDKIKIYGARVKVDSFTAIHDIEKAEQKKMLEKVDKIVHHECNVFINRQLIYNYPEQQLRDKGVYSIEHADFDGIERLAYCLDADIASTFDTPGKVKLGMCDKIEEISIAGDKMLRFVNCKKGAACTIVLRGSSTHIVDEAERSIHDGLAVVRRTMEQNGVVYGGGACELAMAEAVESAARKTQGKMSYAMENFAGALRKIPSILLENGGLDASEILSQLRALHAQNQYKMGVDAISEGIGDMEELGIMESYFAKDSQINAAEEAAEMILRVDDIIRCQPRERQGV